ncbi:MAG: YebC/PmpR family DNA-binding transcriptional regulator [Candidatus Kerfeldbacteria bacterium]|nr:YebC/PmpR family DNA-binding transcriptional regulator [Candidatus Kerfeldbacteria bacterium]
MSGHSKWATIKRSKGAADAKRGALFTKLSKNISIAAKKGKDPEMNPSLRLAVDTAREANMTKDVIERAILRGAGELPGQQIEEITYECYGPGGIALLVHCATDNTNRSASFIKSTLTKFGGNLGGPGSVSYLFKQKGVLRSTDSSETMQLKVVEAGADDLKEEDGGLTVYTHPDAFAAVKTTLGNAVEYAEVSLVPELSVPLMDDEQRKKFEGLLEALEDNEDVVDVTHNAQH